MSFRRFNKVVNRPLISALCCSSEVNLNYGRVYQDVRKQYLKLLTGLVSEHNTPVLLHLKITKNTAVLQYNRLHSQF